MKLLSVPSRLRAGAAGAAAVAGVTAALVTGATAQQQDFSKTAVDIVQVRDNIYMLAAEGGSNVTVQFGPEGA
ncbi:hypothetical protein OVW21_26585, partial [Klebsiella pneumoniae]|uniref:hypothetical protein n=1 Tax=Klebsiella pneumoniae TaxID=573 RepID=UPI00226EFBB2